MKKGVLSSGYSSTNLSTTDTTSLATVLKLTQNSPNRRSPPIKTLTFKFTVPPPLFPSISDYFDVLDELIVIVIAVNALNDIGVWERVSQLLQEQYDTKVSLHVVRKRLWNLSLRHIIRREKNTSQTYYLHPKWKQRILEALL